MIVGEEWFTVPAGKFNQIGSLHFILKQALKTGPKWRLNVRNMRDGEAASKKWWFSYFKCDDVQWKREMPLQLPVASAYLCALHSVILFTLSLYVFGSPSDWRYSSLALEKIYMIEKQSALTVRTVKQWHYVAPQLPSNCLKAIAYFALVVHMIHLWFICFPHWKFLFWNMFFSIYIINSTFALWCVCQYKNHLFWVGFLTQIPCCEEKCTW